MIEPSAAPQEVPASRVHGLSDGVFAIVMTLLVLELHVPEQLEVLGQAARDARISSELVALLPRLLIYVFTFIVAGISWLSHTRLQSNVLHTDRRLAFLNVIYLMLVSLLPFTSGVIGSYGDTPAGVAAYALNQVLIGTAFLGMLRHAVSHSLLRPGWQAERLGQRALVNLGVFALMTAFAFVALPLAWYTPFLLLAAHPLLSRAAWRSW